MNLYSPVISGSLTVTGSTSFIGNVTMTGTVSATASNAALLDGTGSVGFTTTASFLAVSSSQQQISSSQQQISSSLLAISRSYATTGSNTFTGLQNFSNTCNPNGFTSGASIYTAGGLQVTYDSYFSSSIFVNGNLTVYGTQSVVHVSSSQFNVGTNIITVNTATPAIRYGGLSVFDSGSTGLTGSILWDSELNRWIYANASGSGGGATYGGGMFISGPRNAQGLGCEQGTTACMLLVGQGGDHLTSSLVYHSATCTNFYSNVLFVSSSGNVGIGTTIPTASLDVSGCIYIKSASGGVLYIPRLADPNHGLSIGEQNAIGSKSAVIRTGGGVSEHLFIDPGLNDSNIAANIALAYNNTGSVGIGTYLPGAKLEVASPRNSTILRLTAVSGENWDFKNCNAVGSTDVLSIGAAGATANLNLKDDGSVGIGNSLGYNALDVKAIGTCATVLQGIAGFYKATPKGGALLISANDTVADIAATWYSGATDMNLTFSTVPSSGVYHERMRIISSGIACFSCTVCAPKFWSTGDVNAAATANAKYFRDYYIGAVYSTFAQHANPSPGAYQMFCASQGAVLYITSMHNNGRSTTIVNYSNGLVGGMAFTVVNQTSAYSPANITVSAGGSGWLCINYPYGGPTDIMAQVMGGTHTWGSSLTS